MSRFESDDVEHILDQDLTALGQASRKNLPDLNRYAPALERRRPTPRETLFMSSVQTLKTRPWAATAALTAVIVLILLMVPISYTRTTGYEVTLQLPAETEETVASQISTEFGRTLRADNVNHGSDGSESGPLITARISGRTAGTIRKEAETFARFLSEKDLPATASVSPIREQTSTNLLAYATGRILEIRIESDGKTDSEIEADIRNQLEAAGLQNSTVTFRRDGDTKQITIQADCGTDKAAGPEDVNVVVNGSSTGQHKVEIHADQHMSDADLKAEIERQLKATGVDAEVTVTNGQVSIQKRQ